ncbi:hypothetical protein KUTeg_003868 [Tegillarca granosa]|uniref:BTB domain-containing protein n=1 Tax=Tegillarca granosa TaxID=220873 RepID=A0ABQ9FS46_TEGGR|nr:hypothetical protein KUTeg_003868 [Tegillarca granosa]
MSDTSGKERNQNNSSLPVNFGEGSLLAPLNNKSSIADSVSSLDASGNDRSDNGYKYVEMSHPAQILAGLNQLRASSQFCDITLCVDGHEFFCHKVVLASYSPYFKAMFGGSLVESKQDRVSINGVEAHMVELLIDYAYTSEITITRQNVQSLLAAANLMEILTVKDACCDFLQQNMDENNCFGIHCFAESHACQALQEKSKEFILQNFTSAYVHEEFLHLCSSKLMEFLMNEDLLIDSEETVYDASISWLNFDVEGRKKVFEQVFECIRLPLLSPYYIHDVVEKNPVISQSEKCKKLVDEAKTFQLLRDRQMELYSPRTRVRRTADDAEVIVAVGGEDDKVVLRSVETYDPHTCQWRSLACLPFAISKHGLVAAGNNYLYLAGGEYPDGSASKSTRYIVGLAMLDGFMYAIGGWDGTSRLDSVERYNPKTNTWTFIPPIKIPLTSPAVIALEGFLYVTGGAVLEDGDGIDLVQCYNPHTESWSEKKSMLIARSGSAICVLNGLLYVIGGWHASTENTAKVECYDPKTDQWYQKSSMHERRYRPGVAIVSGKIYVCGGEEGWDRHRLLGIQRRNAIQSQLVKLYLTGYLKRNIEQRQTYSSLYCLTVYDKIV